MRWKIRVPETVDFDELVDLVEQAGVQVELAHPKRRIVSVSELAQAPASLSRTLDRLRCTVHDDPQLTVDERQADDRLAPLLKLHDPAVIRDLTEPWHPGSGRPVLAGRCGLWLKVIDGTTREITYDAAVSHDQAFSWLCRNAWLEPDEIAEQRYWTETELARERWRDDARARQARHDLSRLEELLG